MAVYRFNPIFLSFQILLTLGCNELTNENRAPSLAGDGDSQTTAGDIGSDDSSETSEELISAQSIPTLQPGLGFGGPTPTPTSIGSSDQAGYDAKAIARWTTVPYQTLSTDLQIGVLADHRSGIDRVDFSLNGGDWVSVDSKTLNPETEIEEYSAFFSPMLLPDGQVEIRAIAYPHIGQPRVLDSLILFANSAGTLPSQFRYVSVTGDDSNDGLTPATAKRSAMKAAYSMSSLEGATIYFLEGEHTLEPAAWPFSQMSNSSRWLTLRAAPGLIKNQVSLVAGAADTRWGSIRRLRYYNLSLKHETSLPLQSWVSDSRVWYENVQVIGLANRMGKGFAGTFFPGGRYFTDSDFWGLDNGPQGEIVRGVNLSHYLSDAFSSSYLIANSHAEDQDAMGTGAHPDIVQWYGHYENIIVYNLTALNAPDSQGIFQGGGSVQSLKDVSLMNIDLDYGTTIARVLLLLSDTNHLVVRDSNFVGPTSIEGTLSNGLISNTDFSDPPSNPAIVWE